MSNIQCILLYKLFKIVKLFRFAGFTCRFFPVIFLCNLTSFTHASSDEYFQQEVNYEIHVTLNDRLHELSAFETIEYINKSPDTLAILFFHLWPNAYSSENTALARQVIKTQGREKSFRKPELRGYIDSLDFRINGRDVIWDYLSGMTDVCRIILNIPANPGDTLIITTPFHIKIPKGVTSRLGHIGESYQISQWYPKPAVYDKYGWHPMEYLDQGEFYSEFGRFDVQITLPSNYVVAASGNLVDKQESEWLDILSADTAWKEKSDFLPGFPQSSEQLKTVRFTHDNVHDFAWFADKRFIVMKSRQKLPESGREITTFSMFTAEQASLWKHSTDFVNDAILYFSGLLGDYPYDTFTAVQAPLAAGSGMEYPGLTVVGLSDDAYSLDEVIVHEVCHSWFYGALGYNERRYPYMDEGITSAYEERYMQNKYPSKKAWELFFNNEKIARLFNVDKIPINRIDETEWLVMARKNFEKPVNLTSEAYSQEEYVRIIYYKAGMGFNYLRSFMGDSLFDAILRDYYIEWKFRHPQPEDLRNAFESGTGKDLSWFFDDFLGTSKQVDYKIVRLRNEQLLVQNKGEMASPLVISGMFGDSVINETWINGFTGKKWISLPKGDFTGFKIDPNHKMPELYRLNNNLRISGLFPKADPVLAQFYFTLEDPEKISIMYIPLPNWTREDGFMAGMAFHNGFILPERLEYYIIPFFSFGNKNLAGLSRLSYNITPRNSFIRLAKVILEGTQFGAPGFQQYRNLMAGSSLYLRNNGLDNSLRHTLYGYINRASDFYSIVNAEKASMKSYLQAGYIMENAGITDPFRMILSFQSEKTFQKISAVFNYRYDYSGRNNGLDIRLFTGTMLKNNPLIPFYSFSPAGRSGREQYLYQGIYPDRFAVPGENFWSKQMLLSEGSLVTPVNDSLGFSRWIMSLSLSSSLPKPVNIIPVKPFINIVFSNNDSGTVSNSAFFYEAGIKAGIWNFFEVYIPLVVSPEIRSINSIFRDRIRFVLTLDTPGFIKLF